MAEVSKSLSELLTEFRNITTKDAVSPDSLGYLLQRIAEEVVAGNESGALDSLVAQITALSDLHNREFTELDSRCINLSSQISSLDSSFSKRLHKLENGTAGGSVSTGDDGKISSEIFPSEALNVIEFDGMESLDINLTASSSGHKSSDDGCRVVFNSLSGCFLLEVSETNPGGIAVDSRKRFVNWTDAHLFGSVRTERGVIPDAEKLYVDSNTDEIFRWDGEELLSLVKHRRQIDVAVKDNALHVLGHGGLVARGFVPYVFRFTHRHSYKWELSSSGKRHKRKHLHRTGWNLMGSCNTVQVVNDSLVFADINHKYLHVADKTTEFSSDPENLICVSNHKTKGERVAWGRNHIPLNDFKTGKPRRLKLKFAVAFGPKVGHGYARVSPACMVTNLAVFHVIRQKGNWRFGK